VYVGGLAFVNQSVTLIARGGSENPRLPRQPAYECLTLKNELQLYQLLISSIKKSITHYSRKKIRLIQAAYVHSLHRCSSSSKIWVEERKGRKISIRQGDVEIVIEGGMQRKNIGLAVQMLEKRFGKS
jgi:hypothetical protein